MAKYDPNEDVPYGIASADFPVTFYDRPQLMFGNLLQGDVDGMTRAMLSPDTLSPSQMKSVTDVLTRGKKPGPIMETILDIATNPLVIIGLIAALKYPMGSTKVLLDLRKGLLPKAAILNKTMGGLHGALQKLRTIPGSFEAVLGITRETEKFATRHATKANEIFVNAGKISKAEGYAVAARLDGLHKTNHYLYQILHNEPEYVAFMGSKDVPIAANMQKGMRKELISLYDKLRGWYGGIRKELTKDPETWARMQRSAERKGQELGGDVEDYLNHNARFNKYHEAKVRGVNGVNYRKHVENELFEKIGPEELKRHGGTIPELDKLQVLETTGAIPAGFTDQVARKVFSRWSDEAAATVGKIWDDVGALKLGEAEQRLEFSKQVRDYYTKGPGKNLNFVARLGKPQTAADTLDAMGAALQEVKHRGPEAIKAELSGIGRVLAEPPQYTLDPWEATQRYVKTTATSWGLHGTGHREALQKIVSTPGVFRGEPHTQTYLMDNLLPQVLGMKGDLQVQRSLSDAVRKDKILGWLKGHPFVEKVLGPDKSKVLIDHFSKSGSSSSEAIGGQMAHWFHLSTLGLNVAASAANSMQTFLTTINNVGVRGIYRGLMGFGGEEGLISRIGRYGSGLTKGLSTNDAFKTAFPEFVEEMGEWSKTAERLVSGDVAASGFPNLLKAKGVWEKVKSYMMLPFSTTEGGNQLLAFYSGRHQHLFQNAEKLASAGSRQVVLNEARQVGGTLALLTQFAGGPLGVPSSIMNMNPMWRQYAHFPMRYLSYIHGSLRMGADPNKLDWGTIGRALAGSTAAYIAARNLAGIDLSRGLMVGALPLPSFEKAPFYPFPFVSPAAGVIGGVGKALLTGDASQLGSTAAMLVPGGIPLRRAYRNLSPRFADYENKTPDGRIPLYNDEGALLESVTPMQLTLRSLGIQSSDVAAEQGAAKWLLSQRDRIREYRRNYLQALMENDARKADSVNAEFQKVYPELGPIQVKKTDIKAMENRREISRLHRVARGIPTAYRPIFENIIGEASLGQMTQDIEQSSLGLIPNYLQ